MLSVNLDDEAEGYLVAILSEEKVTASALMKQLLRDRFSRYQGEQSILEQMGGEPEHMLSVGGLSDRDNRKAIISRYVQKRHQARHE